MNNRRMCTICEQPIGGIHLAHSWCKKVERRAFGRGIEAAAAVATDYDRLSCHDHLVSDCILAKLNVRKRRPRRNPSKFKNSWLNGYGFALSEVARQNGGDGIEAAARTAGVSLADLKAAGLDPYDIKELRKVLPKPEPADPLVALAQKRLRHEKRNR
jgi:hypothetical protein